MPMNDRETTAVLHGLIRLRHPTGRGEWAVFEEFSPGTGTSTYAGRRWDVLAVACWGSAKGHRICYEVKASRGDWLKELSDPGKRDFARRLCHECWICTVPGVVRDGEAPEGWGVLEAHGSILRVQRAAAQRETVETPDAFVAALARRGAEDGETHPAAPPRGAWKFAGKDVAEVDLVRVAREIIERDDDRQIAASVERKTAELRNRAQRLEELERIVLAGYNADREHAETAIRGYICEWLRMRLDGGSVSLDAIAGAIGELANRVRRGEVGR